MNSDRDSREPSLSADGRLLSFAECGPGFTDPACSNLYFYEQESGQIAFLNVEPDAELPLAGRLSGNGRYLVFSAAANLVPEDDNAGWDIYRLDRQTELVELISGVAGP